MSKKKILFVCLGNICRSPAAEAVMNKLIEKENLKAKIEIDSAGIMGYHTGEQADSRMRKHASKRGYTISHPARKVNPTIDFENFDYVVAMDDENFVDLLAMDKESNYRDKFFRMVQFSQDLVHTSVPDPYYGGPDGFELVLDILEDSCKGLLEKIKDDINQGN